MCASANNLLEAHNITEPPINIYQMLYDEGVPVDFVPFKSNKVEGIYLKNVTGVGIAINANHHPVKKRFTGAHELKHHRHDVPRHGNMLCSTDFDRQIIEQRANRFAAELLMPIHLMQRVWEELNDTGLLSITTLGRAFHVSYDTTVYRLHTLDYISDGERDKLKTPTGRQEDKHTAMVHRNSRNAARLRLPVLIALLGSSDGFSHCSQCSEIVFDTTVNVCHSCGKLWK
jgi:Zn-dependent peptidase ImmA (M78 family)